MFLNEIKETITELEIIMLESELEYENMMNNNLILEYSMNESYDKKPNILRRLWDGFMKIVKSAIRWIRKILKLNERYLRKHADEIKKGLSIMEDRDMKIMEGENIILEKDMVVTIIRYPIRLQYDFSEMVTNMIEKKDDYSCPYEKSLYDVNVRVLMDEALSLFEDHERSIREIKTFLYDGFIEDNEIDSVNVNLIKNCFNKIVKKFADDQNTIMSIAKNAVKISKKAQTFIEYYKIYHISMTVDVDDLNKFRKRLDVDEKKTKVKFLIKFKAFYKLSKMKKSKIEYIRTVLDFNDDFHQVEFSYYETMSILDGSSDVYNVNDNLSRVNVNIVVAFLKHDQNVNITTLRDLYNNVKNDLIGVGIVYLKNKKDY